MEPTPAERTLKAVEELESFVSDMNPETFNRDNSLKEIAQGLREQNDQLESLTKLIRQLIVIQCIPHKSRWDMQVQKNYLEALEGEGLI